MEIDPYKDIIPFLRNDPRYSPELAELIDSLTKLPKFEYSKFYATYSEYNEVITQGDTLNDLKFINFPDENVISGKGVIFSNTCDADIRNERPFSSRILYAPLVPLDSYTNLLENDAAISAREDKREYIAKHIASIKEQRINQIFYLPAGKGMDRECIVFLDSICNTLSKSIDRGQLSERRMCSLSSYGWYIFLQKLANFLTRMSDESVQLRFIPSK